MKKALYIAFVLFLVLAGCSKEDNSPSNNSMNKLCLQSEYKLYDKDGNTSQHSVSYISNGRIDSVVSTQYSSPIYVSKTIYSYKNNTERTVRAYGNGILLTDFSATEYLNEYGLVIKVVADKNKGTQARSEYKYSCN
ncbi:MAG: hypothetical protein F9K23_00910 [Bacteroidetes bacterium]|nr:MAG: hypothetical protein F9K23_00910 [Bacteroidota bacterium]